MFGDRLGFSFGSFDHYHEGRNGMDLMSFIFGLFKALHQNVEGVVVNQDSSDKNGWVSIILVLGYILIYWLVWLFFFDMEVGCFDREVNIWWV